MVRNGTPCLLERGKRKIVSSSVHDVKDKRQNLEYIFELLWMWSTARPEEYTHFLAKKPRLNLRETAVAMTSFLEDEFMALVAVDVRQFALSDKGSMDRQVARQGGTVGHTGGSRSRGSGQRWIWYHFKFAECCSSRDWTRGCDTLFTKVFRVIRGCWRRSRSGLILVGSCASVTPKRKRIVL